MSKKTDDNLTIRIRPIRPPRSRTGEVAAWSTALTTILRYARSTRHGRTVPAAGHTKPRTGSQRCAIRVIYSRNSTPRQWRAHGRYIARESVTGDHRHAGFDSQGQSVDPAVTLDRWQTARDPRLWKLIISPEFGERIDLQRLTRDLTNKMESDLGTKLEWVAVVHLNTEHPHVHVALRVFDRTALRLICIATISATVYGRAPRSCARTSSVSAPIWTASRQSEVKLQHVDTLPWIE